MITLQQRIYESLNSEIYEGLQDIKDTLLDADDNTKQKALEKYITKNKHFSGYGGKYAVGLMVDIFGLSEDTIKTTFNKFKK